VAEIHGSEFAGPFEVAPAGSSMFGVGAAKKNAQPVGAGRFVRTPKCGCRRGAEPLPGFRVLRYGLYFSVAQPLAGMEN